jgi:hypothetical protein
MQFSSGETTWDGLLVAAIIMSSILVLAMLMGNYF